ncbi:hypothetical protein [Nannocystis sp. SCPEA4]|uniref:hypothetical protein n=1 Tax=Nannocystis sp. SCPEA4 TaxID=2996787 RepID=UPI0022706E50|nr:hypothetical protein [Nannocystis sp. SCPEA4]MCY1063033.1 hypothetical protein [Nannocystis sp. SCPEA4]
MVSADSFAGDMSIAIRAQIFRVGETPGMCLYPGGTGAQAPGRRTTEEPATNMTVMSSSPSSTSMDDLPTWTAATRSASEAEPTTTMNVGEARLAETRSDCHG